MPCHTDKSFKITTAWLIENCQGFSVKEGFDATMANNDAPLSHIDEKYEFRPTKRWFQISTSYLPSRKLHSRLP
jgi:hypothetical protein